MTTPAAKAPTPYGKGWRAPWRGQWGPIGDGHSSLGCLARRIERDLRLEYDGTRPLAALLIRQAARLMAMSMATLDQVGTDPKATRRGVSALAGAADRALDKLDKLGARRQPTLPTIEALVAEHRANGGRG